MDQEPFSTSLFKWDPARGGLVGAQPPNRLHLETTIMAGQVVPVPAPAPAHGSYSQSRPTPRDRDLGILGGGLEELFHAYGIRYFTASKIAELGFTVSTLVDMKDEELEDMMNSLSQIFRWELLVGERYGIKAAVRAERRRLDEYEMELRRRHDNTTTNHALDALSQEGLSEEPVQQGEKEMVGSGSGGVTMTWDVERKKQRRMRKKQLDLDEDHDHLHDDLNEEDAAGNHKNNNNELVSERQREHPFIVTEPGEVARGKKNGLDYLFHLYEQCREFLIQVQNIAKERGEKCPTKVTNQVFRYAKKAGASYINKPKMRHYVHCYALHCLDEEGSNALRRVYKERGENVGAWRQACYKPLVSIAASQGWDIDAIFNSHPRLSIWYVPTKLRQLCHSERNVSASTSTSTSLSAPHHLPF